MVLFSRFLPLPQIGTFAIQQLHSSYLLVHCLPARKHTHSKLTHAIESALVLCDALILEDALNRLITMDWQETRRFRKDLDGPISNCSLITYLRRETTATTNVAQVREFLFPYGFSVDILRERWQRIAGCVVLQALYWGAPVFKNVFTKFEFNSMQSGTRRLLSPSR